MITGNRTAKNLHKHMDQVNLVSQVDQVSLSQVSKLRRGKNRQAFLNSTHSASSSARPSTSMSRVKLLMSQGALILSFQFLMFDWEGAVLARVKGRSGSNQN